jgi:hypothetical protein
VKPLKSQNIKSFNRIAKKIDITPTIAKQSHEQNEELKANDQAEHVQQIEELLNCPVSSINNKIESKPKECSVDGDLLIEANEDQLISKNNDTYSTPCNNFKVTTTLAANSSKNRRTVYGLRDIPRRDYTPFYYKLDEL